MIKDIFYSEKLNDKIAIVNAEISYSYKDIKALIAGQMEFLEDKSNNIVISGDDNFSFIIQFFASVFLSKNIYLVTDKKILENFQQDYYIAGSVTAPKIENYKFPQINFSNGNINFYTSGSTGEPKVIKKSLLNLICEAQDITKIFDFRNSNYMVISTTMMSHLFGLTFHLMVPLCQGLKIDVQSAAYPENVNRENSILVSSPSFLSSACRYNLEFTIPPKYIITAGSKIDNEIFEYYEKKSNVIEIYGSTESGVIAYKTHYDSEFNIFENVKIHKHENYAKIISNYSYNEYAVINDELEIKNNKLLINGRSDRMMKICEKRVSAPALEQKINTNELINDCYVFKSGEKAVCLCALSDKGKDYIINNSPADLTKILKKYVSESFEIIPQRWKYIDEIPMTKSGKINRRFIEKIFNTEFSFPVILDKHPDNGSIICKVYFYENCNFFKGHFPDFKIVPGVVQLYFAKETADMYFDLGLGEGQWKRIKFSNIIKSNSIIYLKLEKTEKSLVFEYYDEKSKYSSGVFSCKNIFME